MKKWIRSWLGIEATKLDLKSDVHDPIRRYVNKRVSWEVSCILRKSDTGTWFNEEAREAVIQICRNVISEETQKVVSSEQFVDDIVDRIKRKQLVK